LRYSDELLPIVSQALNSPNPITVTQAALFLGEHGSPSSQDLLWQRLESLWTTWNDRASELQVAPMNFSTGSNPIQQAAQLEQALPPRLHMQRIGNWALRRSIGYVPAASQMPAAKLLMVTESLTSKN
jgi:hypothetical protein